MAKRTVAATVVGALLVALVASVPWASPAGAHSLPAMTELADVVNGNASWSLREGVNHVADHPGIETHVHLVEGQTYVLDKCDAAGGSLKVTGSGRLMIDGGGSTIVQTCPGEPVFEILGSGGATFYDVTITGGTGGGIVSTGGDVFVDRSAVVGNSSSDDTPTALDVVGPLKIWNSTIASNTGGSGGTVAATSTLNVVNSTIVGNDGPQLSSAISSGHKLFGSVLAEPEGGANCAMGGSTANSAGQNWSTDGSCPLKNGTDGDVSGAPSPQLRPLFRNGGPLSFYPEKTSPLLDRIPGSHVELPPWDQRTLVRPQGSHADVGAIEVARCGSLFADIAANHPFCWEIGWLAGAEVTTGYGTAPNRIFKPDDQVTRQSMAAFMYRLAGSPRGPSPTCASAPFPDVGRTQSFCGEIDWLVDQGITTGYSDGTYKPLATVGRQAMAAFMYRLAGSPNGAGPGCTSAPFPDIAADHPFCGEITWLVGTGVTAGYSDGTFKPDNIVTRQSMAAFMYRLAGGLID